jgi:hypothetical protein
MPPKSPANLEWISEKRIRLVEIGVSRHQPASADPVDLAASTAGKYAQIGLGTVLEYECVRGITIWEVDTKRVHREGIRRASERTLIVQVSDSAERTQVLKARRPAKGAGIRDLVVMVLVRVMFRISLRGHP